MTDCSIAGNAMVLERVWTGNTMRALLRNTSDAAVRVREVALMYGNFPLAASCPFYSEGFHMLSQHGGALHESHNIGKYGTDEEFFSLKKSPFSPDTYTAYSLMLLSPTQYDRALMAFSSCNKFMGEFRFKNNYIEIVMDCEDIELRPGETWQFEEFIALFGGKRDALFEKLAEHINEKPVPRASTPILRLDGARIDDKRYKGGRNVYAGARHAYAYSGAKAHTDRRRLSVVYGLAYT